MKNLTQTFTSPEKWYTLEYPRVWEVEIYDHIPAFFDPFEGKGALQVFSVQLGKEESIPENLKQLQFLSGKTLRHKTEIFLDNQSIAYEKDQIVTFEKAGMEYAAIEYYKEGRFYMACLIQSEPIFVLTLYNCKDSPDTEEAKTVSQIIQSIKIIQENSI